MSGSACSWFLGLKKRKKIKKKQKKTPFPHSKITLHGQGMSEQSGVSTISTKKARKAPLHVTQKSWVKELYEPANDELRVPELDGAGKKVTWLGPQGKYKKAKTKLVPSQESFRKRLREKKIHPGCRWDSKLASLICVRCDVQLDANKTMFDEHFGFGKNKVNAKHLEQLGLSLEEDDGDDKARAPQQKTVEELGAQRQAAKETKRELFTDMVLYASEANMTAGQLNIFRPFLTKWLKPGTGFVRDADFEWQFRSKRPVLYEQHLKELETCAKQHQQLTIAVDAKTDARHAKGMYFTLDFDMDSYLWKSIFEGQRTPTSSCACSMRMSFKLLVALTSLTL